MLTLTMFALHEFVDEVKRFGDALPEVRMQPMRSTRGGGELGPEIVYQVALTHSNYRDEVVACTIVVGQARAVFVEHEPWHADNLEVARKVLKRYLDHHGLYVMPGEYEHAENGRASCHLWRIDRETHALIPGAEWDDDDQNR